jgi:hypothetical protein
MVNGLDSQALAAPQLSWPPPEDPQEKFNFFLELLWQSNVRRAIAFYRGIVESLNESNVLVFIVVFRALFEQILLLRAYCHDRIYPVMAESTSTGIVTNAQLQQLIGDLYTAVARTKFEWEKVLKGNIEGLAGASNAPDGVGLKAAARAWTGPLGLFTPTQLYDLLCDSAHPNIGGTLLLMRSDTFGWADSPDSSIGARTFAQLCPSLVAVSKEFNKLVDFIRLSKFEPTR